MKYLVAFSHVLNDLFRCISEKNMAESLELHVIRAFFAKVEKTAPFTNVSFLESASANNGILILLKIVLF